MVLNHVDSGNDTSYDQQEAPEVPEAIAEAIEKAGGEGAYVTPNWGGSGGDWCR